MNNKKGYIDMVGDLFHYGHINQIKRVFDLGYEVIVGVHSDKVVESYKRKPILSMKERIKVIECCKYITKVIPNAPLIITKEYLDKHNIDMVFHGHKIEEESYYKKMYKIPNELGKFTRTEYTPKISTTEIINKIIERRNNLTL